MDSDEFVWSSELPPMNLDSFSSQGNGKENNLLLAESRQARRESFMKNGALSKLAATFDSLNGQWQGEKARRESGASLGPPPQPPQQALISQDLNIKSAAVKSISKAPAAQKSTAQALSHPLHSTIPPVTLQTNVTGTLIQLPSSIENAASVAMKPPSSSIERLFTFSTAQNSSSQVQKHAIELFEESEILILCDEGLNKQLTRTKDGATEQSRIQELAAIVKTLRKCVRELASRTNVHVEHCTRIERDLLKQVEGILLQSESAVRGLEAELAGAKKDLAQYEATFKMDKAKWGADLEDQKYEMMRLKRELDRLTEERDRARDEWKRAEGLKQQLEGELKDLKKHSTQQIREVASNQNETILKLTEAAEKREAALKDDRQRLSKRLDAAQSCIEALQGELSTLQQIHTKTEDSLRTHVASEESLSRSLHELQSDHEQGVRKLAETSAQCKEMAAELEGLKEELNATREASERHEIMANEMKARVDLLESTLRSERLQWAEEKRAFVHQESSLTLERDSLRSAKSEAMSIKEECEKKLSELSKEHQVLVSESVNLKHQVDFATGCHQQAEHQSVELQSKLESLTKEMEEASEELTVKGSRLFDLESEFEALKEVLGESGQRDVVNNLLKKISMLQNAVAASDAVRRKIHNELVEVKGNIRVYCRVRPNANGASSLKCYGDGSSLSISVDGKDHSMDFDKVFPQTTSQEEVFNGVSELVQSALDGYHVCLFSYGQTGAGKTYTMQGSNTPSGRGIIPRAVEKILQTAASLQDQEWEYSMEASFIEIYNNQLKDLLGGPHAPFINDQNAIKHDANGGHTTVVGISRVPIKDAAFAGELVQRAAQARSCESTAMNASSSRSHSIFMLYITGSHPPTSTQLQGCLCLVDLAGSERLDRSHAEGQRKAEACAINQSLSSIGDVFAALASKSSHIPYRNTKLTYLLQPCLGGHGKTLMFVNVNPEPSSAYESLCSLKFAQKVNGCETAASRVGAKRNGTTSNPSSSSSSSAEVMDKRFSLPGLPVPRPPLPSQQEGPVDKRMSLIGAKRPAPSNLPMPPPPPGPPSQGAKRIKPN